MVLIAEDESKRHRLKKALNDDPTLQAVLVCSPEELALFLDSLAESSQSDERIVRGYKVRVKRQNQSPSDMAMRRDTIGKVITRSVLDDE